MKPGNPALQSTRLLDQMRERIRHMHYSLGTETVYLCWVRFFRYWRPSAKFPHSSMTVLGRNRWVTAIHE